MREIINKQKAPKDIVLNNIMKEIDEENGIVADAHKIDKEHTVSTKKKKRSWLRLFFNLMLLIIFLCVLFILYLINMANTEQVSQKEPGTSTHQQIVVPIKVNKPLGKTIQINKDLNTQVTPPSNDTLLTQERELARIRQKAKAALMEQMKN